MKYKLITLIFAFLLVGSFVVAEVELTIPFNQEFDLKRQCFNNGTFCSSQAVCNTTILYPDGTILTDNQEMTNQNSFHNLTLTNFNISQLGIMFTTMICDDPGGQIIGSNFDTFEIEVTGDGSAFRTFPLEFSIIAFAFLLIGVSYTNDRLRLFRTVGGLLAMAMGVVTLFPGYANLNYSTLPGLGVGLTTIGLGFFFLISDSLSYDRQVETFQQSDDGRFHE
ncbi:hypothetical protein LCGC14_0937050 [marine sediment metagenome]|uniref:Uncharacterized protein n=1 Tax=marine sediment metagenome TaxID=412755 RepID=A0A0F9RSM3_9ZZZZ